MTSTPTSTTTGRASRSETRWGSRRAWASRSGALAFVALGLAYASLAQGIGWNQLAHYSLVRALGDGTPVVDAYRAETGDVAWIDGHYYASKAPGLALATLPLYVALDSTGLASLLAAAPGAADDTVGMLWSLGLLGCVLPAIAIAVLVRRLGDEVEPGFGLPAAIAAGAGTLLLPFATLFFAHVLAAALAFAAFAALWLRRSAVLAGVFAGLAVVADYPLALAGVILAAYAVMRSRRAGAAFAAGLSVGLLPLLLYQWWAFGSLIRSPYGSQVLVGGTTGHDVAGLHASGLSLPRPAVAVELLFAQVGLLRLSPVLALAVIGVVLMYRKGLRAEAVTIGSIAVLYLAYVSGYFVPFGGFVPGPRFLVPILPFLGVALAPAFKRLPLTSMALAALSIVLLTVVTATGPLLAFDGRWWQRLEDGWFAGRSWYMVVPFAVLVGAALSFAVRAMPRVPASDSLTAVAALAAWFGVSAVAPDGFGWSAADALLVAASAAVAIVAVTVLAREVRLDLRWRSARLSSTRSPRPRSSPI
jgi:hypothetical protein